MWTPVTTWLPAADPFTGIQESQTLAVVACQDLSREGPRRPSEPPLHDPSAGKESGSAGVGVGYVFALLGHLGRGFGGQGGG